MSDVERDSGEWDDLEVGDEIEYVGPDELRDYSTPEQWKMPFVFSHETHIGGIKCKTCYGGVRRYSPEHPANDRDHWRVVDE